MENNMNYKNNELVTSQHIFTGVCKFFVKFIVSTRVTCLHTTATVAKVKVTFGVVGIQL